MVSGLVFINDRKILSSNVFSQYDFESVGRKSFNVEDSTNNSENLERLKRVVEKYNRALEQHGKEIHMNFDKEINRVVIRIFDKETSKLVYEFPYKEIRQLIAMLQDFNDTMFNEIA